MATPPKISIITPSYNSEKSIKSCILSVANQRYFNKEHLIIDGQSNDRTLDIVKNYGEIYPYLKWRSEKDDGIYDAMNKGIDWSTGDWVYFLGSDDIYYDNKVLVNIFTPEISNLDVIYGNVEWGETGQIYDGPFSRLKLIEKNICHQAIFYKKNVFTQLGKFQLEYDVLADWVFNMKWFNSDHIKWKYVENIIAKYGGEGYSTQNPDNTFMKNNSSLIQTYFSKEYFEIYQRLLNLKHMINIKNLELLHKDYVIQEKEEELSLIKATKFWKFRNYYIKFKNIISSF